MSSNFDAAFGFIVAAAILGVVAFLGWSFGQVVVSATTSSRCLELGHAESNVDYKFSRYCVVRDYRGVMQAIPLNEARAQPSEEKNKETIGQVYDLFYAACDCREEV